MVSMSDAPSPNTDESSTPPPKDSVQPTMTFGGMPTHMYPMSTGSFPMRSKRRQVKNACTNCQKACKKCDDARPCLRCVTYGTFDNCVDSQRKERKKGVKRGPYKKRDGKDRAGNNNVESADVPVQQQGAPINSGAPSTATGSSPVPGFVPIAYSPTMFNQYPPPAGQRPGEGNPFPGYVMVPASAFMAPATAGGQENEGSFTSQPQFYHPAFLHQYAQYVPYMIRPDGQMATMAGPHYYNPLYARPPSGAGSHEAEAGPSNRADGGKGAESTETGGK